MDLDWASDLNSQRLVSGYAFIFCGTAVAWLAKKQLTIALLSMEAEYMALTHARKESTFLEHLYRNVSIPISPPIFLLVDNQSAIALVENPIFHTCSKHIEVQHHWVCEKIEGGLIELEYIPTADQVADIFTKPLMVEKFQRFCGALGLVPVELQGLSGHVGVAMQMSYFGQWNIFRLISYLFLTTSLLYFF